MTIPVLFLVGALGLSFVLGLIVWLVSRPRKQKFGSTIDSFHNDLSAMAPSRLHSRRTSGGLHRGAGAPHRQAAKARPKPGPRPRS